MLWIYTFLYCLVGGLLLPKEVVKRPAHLRKKWLKEKFGIFKREENFFKRKVLWIHAVSVGEIAAVSNLIKILSQKYDILLSTVTDTGQKVALEKFKNFPVKVIYLPFDYPLFIKKVIKIFKPSALIIAETEIWPNLIFTASKFVPLFLINARLSEKSFKGYNKIKFFIKPVLNCFTLIAVQSEEYKNRFKALGVPEEKIIVAGNMKFDMEIPLLYFSWEKVLPRPIIIAGSTHDPEEKLITDAFLKLDISGTLFIAPRHPERFEEVEKVIKNMITKNKTKFLRFSELNEKISNIVSQRIIILVDKIGILASLYRICDVAIIGGSFIPHGGQNPLEAIYWKKPVIFGTSMENFPFIKEFLEKKACFQVSKDSLSYLLKKLLDNPEEREKVGKKAYQIFEKKKGATEKILKCLEKFI